LSASRVFHDGGEEGIVLPGEGAPRLAWPSRQRAPAS
jgi:hypothetical protein